MSVHHHYYNGRVWAVCLPCAQRKWHETSTAYTMLLGRIHLYTWVLLKQIHLSQLWIIWWYDMYMPFSNAFARFINYVQYITHWFWNWAHSYQWFILYAALQCSMCINNYIITITYESFVSSPNHTFACNVQFLLNSCLVASYVGGCWSAQWRTPSFR